MRDILYSIVLITCLGWLFSFITEGYESQDRRILNVHFYHTDGNWRENILRGLRLTQQQDQKTCLQNILNAEHSSAQKLSAKSQILYLALIASSTTSRPFICKLNVDFWRKKSISARNALRVVLSSLLNLQSILILKTNPRPFCLFLTAVTGSKKKPWSGMYRMLKCLSGFYS